MNQLTKIDLSEYPNLHTFDCSNNLLTTLDVSSSPRITHLSCYANKLTNLDITPLANELEAVNCGNQQDDITLNLTLNAIQKIAWENNWSVNGSWANGRVTLNVVDGGDNTQNGSSNTSGSDFNIEGIY